MQVHYKRLIEGVTTPAIIHNRSYFLIDMPVYEDGSMDCWERIHMDNVSDKLKKGWLVTAIPDGEALSIHQLADFRICNARWNYSPKSYKKHLGDIVKSMNCKRVGLYRETEEQSKKWTERRIKWSTKQLPYKISGRYGYNLINGRSTEIFIRSDDMYHLTSIIGFSDDTFQIDGQHENISKEEIKEMILQGQLVSSPPLKAAVSLKGFGTVQVLEMNWAADAKEKMKEIFELPNEAGGRETTHDRCIRLYFEYLQYPSETARELLRQAYEAVPEHERMFLGDMDSKDSDYRRILYEPHRKREV